MATRMGDVLLMVVSMACSISWISRRISWTKSGSGRTQGGIPITQRLKGLRQLFGGGQIGIVDQHGDERRSLVDGSFHFGPHVIFGIEDS